MTLNTEKVEKFSDNTCVSFVNLTDKDGLSYSQKRREYKELLRHKKQSHKSNILQSLQTHIKDPKKFWNTIRLLRNKPGGHSAVTTEEWYIHFNNVFNSPSTESESTVEDFEDRAQVNNEMYCETLNQPITEDEISAAIKALKDQKAAGPDGLI